ARSSPTACTAIRRRSASGCRGTGRRGSGGRHPPEAETDSPSGREGLVAPFVQICFENLGPTREMLLHARSSTNKRAGEKRETMIGTRAAVGFLCLVMLAGCASSSAYTVKRADPVVPCQIEVPERDLLLGVALSGGGSRAALFGASGLE